MVLEATQGFANRVKKQNRYYNFFRNKKDC